MCRPVKTNSLFCAAFVFMLHFYVCFSIPREKWNTVASLVDLEFQKEQPGQAFEVTSTFRPIILYESSINDTTNQNVGNTMEAEPISQTVNVVTTPPELTRTIQTIIPTMQKETPPVTPPAIPPATPPVTPPVTPLLTPVASLVSVNKEKSVCPQLKGDFDDFTQTTFSSLLTEDCRYDKLTKPNKGNVTDVVLQIDIRHIEAMEQLQFKMHILVQYKYNDSRLNYEEVSPTRGHMLGEDTLRSKIWIPHLVLSNERDTSIMGLEGKDVFVSISPTGEIIYSYRMTAMIYCWMDLLYFPFDEQTCSLHFMSWTYNASQLLLKWDEDNPAKVASQLHLTEFRLLEYHTKVGSTPAPLNKGAFAGNYSTLILEFKVSREIGYYLMDYFIPSIMLVCTSWVTFWLQADNAAPRVALGTSTMLSFITLASGQSKNLPKVSYIKVSEIWFLVCSFFIFASMVEFAFVNIIWRRKKEVELKKVNSKYILKSTITPKLARRELERSSSGRIYKTRSCGSLNGNFANNESNEKIYNNYLTVNCSRDIQNIPKITMQSAEPIMKVESDTTIDMEGPQIDQAPSGGWTTMTPQEVAIWIDKRSRIFFPALFFLFNAVFWTVVLSV